MGGNVFTDPFVSEGKNWANTKKNNEVTKNDLYL